MKLLETIYCNDAHAYHLNYHQARMNNSFKGVFNKENPFHLALRIKAPSTGVYRCRVVYDSNTCNIQYTPYSVRYLQHFRVIHTDISYTHKFLDRSCFVPIKDADEAIYIVNGFVTDTGIANIACKVNNTWLTPHTPLLEGTTRARLIDENVIKPAPITLQTLLNADSVAMMNALTGFYEIPHVQISL